MLQHMGFGRDQFQMLNVGARLPLTAMMQLVPGGHGAMHLLPSDVMHDSHPPLVTHGPVPP